MNARRTAVHDQQLYPLANQAGAHHDAPVYTGPACNTLDRGCNERRHVIRMPSHEQRMAGQIRIDVAYIRLQRELMRIHHIFGDQA